MRTLRLAALVLLVSACGVFAQTEPNQPCGAGMFTFDELFLRDQTGATQSFCVRERRRLRFSGAQTLWAAVSTSPYCEDAARGFGKVTKCKFIARVRCDSNREPPAFVIALRLRNCRNLLGRSSLRATVPLADMLTPPGSSVDGAFPSPSGAFLEP